MRKYPQDQSVTKKPWNNFPFPENLKSLDLTGKLDLLRCDSFHALKLG